MADADLVHVAAKDAVHPDAGVLAENDVADDLGGFVDIGRIGELGSDAIIGADHKFIRCWTRNTGPAVPQNATLLRKMRLSSLRKNSVRIRVSL
jgi:hypothetical protein